MNKYLNPTKFYSHAVSAEDAKKNNINAGSQGNT